MKFPPIKHESNIMKCYVACSHYYIVINFIQKQYKPSKRYSPATVNSQQLIAGCHTNYL